MCIYQNVRGLNTKLDEFYSYMSDAECDIVAISETWLQPDVGDSELLPNHYQVFRKDRNLEVTGRRTGGGVLLAFKDHIQCSKVDTTFFSLNFPDIDLLICKCILKHKTFYVLLLYVPPSVPVETFVAFLESIEMTDLLHDKGLLVLGDFNIPDFIDSNLNDRKFTAINHFINFYSLQQLNNIRNKLNRLLDLVISNISCVVTPNLPPIVREDDYHPSLFIQIQNISENKKVFQPSLKRKAYNFKRADFFQLYQHMVGIDWSFLLQVGDVNLAVDGFYENLYSLFDLYVPTYKNFKRKFPPWFDSTIIKNIKEKDKLFRKCKMRRDDHLLYQYKNIRSQIKRQINLAYKLYLTKIQSTITTDSRQFWSYVNQKNKASRIPGVMVSENNSFSNPVDIVNKFAELFKSVFVTSSDPDEERSCLYKSKFLGDILNVGGITEDEIIRASKKLKNKMTSGSDDVPSFLVRDCIGVLAYPLKVLFNLALESVTFPSRWKEARIVPVFKSGDRSEINNYRPISILSNFSKIFEIVLYDRIYPAVRNLIAFSQHGFMSRRSTETNLLLITQHLAEELDARGQVDVIYTDFSKAFDRMDHGILLEKLHQFGFSSGMTQFCDSYVKDRRQFVFYNGHQSEKYISTSGVPQGSNLGPLLFLLFINDLDSQLNANKLFYADDLKIYLPISNWDNCVRLQLNLDGIFDWCLINKLSLNISKCKTVTFTRKKSVIEFAYNMDGAVLSRQNTIKDLGVVFDSKLSFVEHIDLKISEAQRIYGFIVRNCRGFSNVIALKSLFFAYVRSKLEYCSNIWNPHYNIHVARIESLQRKFLKYLVFKIDNTYPERGIEYQLLLDRFNFDSLELRRLLASLTCLFKLVHNVIDCPELLYLINFNVPQFNNRQNLMFYNNQPRTNLLIRSPVYNMCYSFNLICNSCDLFFDSLNQIKRLARNL